MKLSSKLLLVGLSCFWYNYTLCQFTPKPTKTPYPTVPYYPPTNTPYIPTPPPITNTPYVPPVITPTPIVGPTIIVPNGATIRITIEMAIDGPPQQPWAPLGQFVTRTTNWLDGTRCIVNVDSSCMLSIIKITPTPLTGPRAKKPAQEKPVKKC